MIFKIDKNTANYKLLTSKPYLFGLLVKIVCAFIFAGELFKNSFVPFVSYFVDSRFSNPYSHYIGNHETDAFPYPALMLFIFTVFKFIFGNSWIIQPLLFRIPLLIADTVILIFLCRMLKGKEKRILFFYWCSPVLLYISYVQGQFDALPVMFLIIAFYLLFKKRLILSGIVLGLALATKTNMILVLPFYLVYVWKDYNENKLRQTLLSLLLMGATFILINSPYLLNKDYFEMVFKNKQQGKVWNFTVNYGGNLLFFVIPALYFFLLAKFVRYKHLSKDVFMMFVGFVFSSLILFIAPMPGWYFWAIPFLTYFYAKENKLTILPLVSLQLTYLAYFAVIEQSDYLKVFVFSPSDNSIFKILSLNGINAQMIVNIFFTILQTLLLINIYWVYKIGISAHLKARIKNVPCFIGIGGDSGVGKSTMSNSFEKLFSKEGLTIITGDDMHKWERGHEMWKEHTHLSPNANRLHEEIAQMKALKNGNKITRRIYDHDTGKFTESVNIYSNKVILFEGLHPFYISAKRELYDIKIFMNPEETLRIHWKVCRDVEKRNYSKEKVLEQLKAREGDSIKYIQSQAPYADIEIIYFPLSPIKDIGNDLPIEIGLKVRFGTNLDIETLHQQLNKVPTLKVFHYYEMSHQVIEVIGNIDKKQIAEITYKLIPDAEEIIENPVFEDDYKGFLQLFVLYYIAQNID